MKLVMKIILGLGLFFVGLIGVLLVAAARAKAGIADQYPPIGEMVDVGGYKLHVHSEVAKQSTNAKFIVAENSGHDIPVDEPEVIIQSILEVLQTARQRISC